MERNRTTLVEDQDREPSSPLHGDSESLLQVKGRAAIPVFKYKTPLVTNISGPGRLCAPLRAALARLHSVASVVVRVGIHAPGI